MTRICEGAPSRRRASELDARCSVMCRVQYVPTNGFLLCAGVASLSEPLESVSFSLFSGFGCAHYGDVAGQQELDYWNWTKTK